AGQRPLARGSRGGAARRGGAEHDPGDAPSGSGRQARGCAPPRDQPEDAVQPPERLPGRGPDGSRRPTHLLKARVAPATPSAPSVRTQNVRTTHPSPPGTASTPLLSGAHGT